MEQAKAQDNLEEVRWVDHLDEINHLAAYLDFITGIFPERLGETLRLSPGEADGFCLLLMNIGDRLKKVSGTLHQTLTDLSARAAEAPLKEV